MRKAEASQRQLTKAAQEAVAQQFLVLEPILLLINVKLSKK